MERAQLPLPMLLENGTVVQYVGPEAAPHENPAHMPGRD